MTRKPFSPSVCLGLAAGQIALAVIIAAVTSQQLDNGDCYLNLIPGRVCDFVYSTVGFSLLFTLMLAVPTVLWQMGPGKTNSIPLIPEAAQLGLFGSFWWLVLSITITSRGKQAQDANLPGDGARGATIAFSWIQTVLFLATAAVVIVDRYQFKSCKADKEDDASSEPSSTEGYVFTQALARTPVT